jgi:shikimate dehydrogenase
MSGDLLVNATSVGMHPLDRESPVPKEVLKEGMVIMDIVYSPLKTRLLREAEERGCRTIDGLEMLARQGAAQLDIWTGKRQGVEQIKEDLRRVLVARINSLGGRA